MKITESRLKEIIREEFSVAIGKQKLNEEGYAGKIINFLKSLSPPKDERPKRKEPEEEEPEEEKPEEEEVVDGPSPEADKTDFPIQITTQEFAEFINKTNFAKVAKMFKKLGIDKDAAEIKKKLISLLPALFRSFDKALIDSDVGDYFRLQGAVNETIDINKRIGVGSAPESNLIIFVFGGLLKNYINKQSKEVKGFVEIPQEKLDQLQNSVSGLTNKTLRNILSSKETGTATPTAPPEEEAPEPAPDTPADSAPQPEPVSEPQAAEEPLKIITKILSDKGVNEEKVSAFINDLRKMGVIQEIAPRALKNSLKMNKDEWREFSQKHTEVIEAINQLRGRSKKARALRTQFKDALSGIIAREKMPKMPRRRRKKKSPAAPKSKAEPNPAPAAPAEPAPLADPEPEPEEEKQLDISQIKENVLEAWRDYYNKDLKEPDSLYSAATMKNVMKRVDGVIDAGDTEYGTIVRFADIRSSKDEPYNAFVVPKRKKENIHGIERYYNIKNKDETQTEVRVKDIEKLAQYIIFNTKSVEAIGSLAEKGELEIVGSEKSPDLRFTRRATTRIKKNYNKLETGEKLSHRFDTWKKQIERLQEVESIKKVTFGENNKLYLITLTNGEQFGLPYQGDIHNSSFAFEFTPSTSVPAGDARLKDVLRLAKIKDGKIKEKGLVNYGTKLEESLMLRWKTIAGIK